MGIRPPVGEIFDMFLVVSREYLRTSFTDLASVAEAQQLYGSDPTPEQTEAWESARELASLLGWRPYMHDPSLPHVLRRAQTPTLSCGVAIVPLRRGEAYHRAIPGSRLVVLDRWTPSGRSSRLMSLWWVREFLQD